MADLARPVHGVGRAHKKMVHWVLGRVLTDPHISQWWNKTFTVLS